MPGRSIDNRGYPGLFLNRSSFFKIITRQSQPNEKQLHQANGTEALRFPRNSPALYIQLSGYTTIRIAIDFFSCKLCFCTYKTAFGLICTTKATCLRRPPGRRRVKKPRNSVSFFLSFFFLSLSFKSLSHAAIFLCTASAARLRLSIFLSFHSFLIYA